MNAPLPKGRLGRGLASLIGEPTAGGPQLPPHGEQRLVPISEVKAGRLNPRKDFREDELAELAVSIRNKGLVQPIIVRPADGSRGSYPAGLDRAHNGTWLKRQRHSRCPGSPSRVASEPGC
jgi:ParB family chromosome partitioning protein